jgi:membrane-associated phospholipid phosphatase
VISRYLKLPKKEHSLYSICLVFLLSFLLVTFFRTSFHSLDVSVNLWIPSIQSNALTLVAQGVALIFDTISLITISLIISGYLFLKHYKSHGLLLLGAIGSDAMIVSILKTVEHVARPTNSIVPDSGFSYPSGHSTGCVVFGGVLAYFAWRHWQSTRSRAIIGSGMGIVAGVVSFDRLYLNVHWVSDVLGGLLFGAFWLSFVILLFRQTKQTKRFESDRFDFVANLLYFAAVVVSVFIVLFSLHGNFL